MRILVTGVAGFIGFHLAKRLFNEDQDVVGIDNINDYYDKSLKQARLEKLIEIKGNFEFNEVDICDKKSGWFYESN